MSLLLSAGGYNNYLIATGKASFLQREKARFGHIAQFILPSRSHSWYLSPSPPPLAGSLCSMYGLALSVQELYQGSREVVSVGSLLALKARSFHVLVTPEIRLSILAASCFAILALDLRELVQKESLQHLKGIIQPVKVAREIYHQELRSLPFRLVGLGTK